MMSEVPILRKKTTDHKWKAFVPVRVQVIKNEDGEWGFMPHADLRGQVALHYNPDHVGCTKCGKNLKDVFGDPCSFQEN